MKRVRFPARGSVVERPLVEDVPTKPVDGELPQLFAARKAACESLAAVVVRVVLLDDLAVIELNHRFTLWGVAEEGRRKELRDAGKPVPAMTLEGLRELRTLQRDVVALCVRGVDGIDIDDIRSEDVAPDKLADHLAAAGVLADVANLARGAQAPTPVQLER